MAYYKNYSLNLLSGEKKSYAISDWVSSVKEKPLFSYEEKPRIIHLFYELGFLIEKNLQLINEDDLLVIDCEFKDYKKIYPKSFKKIDLTLRSSPLFEEYKLAFDKGYEDLLAGNCYQFNLTYPFSYSFHKGYSPFDLIFSLWENLSSRGAFGSATYIPLFQKMFLSNSPECLFQLKGSILSTMPIKGTIKREKSKKLRSLWETLKKDKKSQAELFMISDLLRNDLSRIEKPQARIVKKKFPKLVPGLLHQCSQVDVKLSSEVNIWRIIEKLYPGGSITGAPKLRAMRLICKLENRKRGFYCGSSLILFKEMKSASINIRSSEIKFGEEAGLLIYQAGGGITLLSNAEDEYKEMTYKVESFINTLTL